ncbi:MAG: ABC transporter substrate-binding protein [Acetobacteraceae bacterium]
MPWRMLLAAATLALGWSAARAADEEPLRIGVLEDLSGPNSENSGVGTVEAVKMAVEDFGGKVLGRPIQVLVATDQNKPDVAVSIARQWFGPQHVAMITGLPNSASSLAVNQIARETDKIDIVAAAASSDITGKGCSPNSIHWFMDTYASGSNLVSALISLGWDTWFFVTVDYNFGLALQADATRFIEARGGKVLGSAKHPLGETDFSSVLLRAQASGAKVIALANASADLDNAIKGAKEFHLVENGQHLAVFFLNTPNVAVVGQAEMAGSIGVTPIFPALNPETLAWSHRLVERVPAVHVPTAQQLGAYGAVLHYLKAVAAAGTSETGPVLAKMREMPVNDPMTRNGRVREDGRLLRDLYVFQVKPPSESTDPFDYFKVLKTIPAEQAFRPLKDGNCPYVR